MQARPLCLRGDLVADFEVVLLEVAGGEFEGVGDFLVGLDCVFAKEVAVLLFRVGFEVGDLKDGEVFV